MGENIYQNSSESMKKASSPNSCKNEWYQLQYFAIPIYSYNIAIVTSKCDDHFGDNVYQDLTIAIATTKCGDPFGEDV